jgi:hypothetical protein
MIGRNSETVSRDRYLVGLAVAFIGVAFPFLAVEKTWVPFGLLLAGFVLLTSVTWSVTSKWRKVFQALATIVVALICAYMGSQVYPESNSHHVQENKQPLPPFGDLPPIEPSKRPVTQEITVFLYNDANDPQFSVDGRPASPQYSSGIATLRLPAGTHNVHAEYSTRTCSATVTVPMREPGPVAANCRLKKVGGS